MITLQMMSMNATKTPHPASMVQRVAILPLVLLPVTVLVLALEAQLVQVNLMICSDLLQFWRSSPSVVLHIKKKC